MRAGTVWSEFSAVDAKARWFPVESYFREAYADFQERLGDVSWYAQNVLAITLKPETIVSANVSVVVDYLERNGFVPFFAHVGRHSRCAIREIWRYQWNVATLERLELMERVMCHWPSVWLLAWDERRGPTGGECLPATVRFRELKGSAIPSQQRPGQLRTLLDGGNRTLTFVHAADEPIDVVREVGILFDRRGRARITDAIDAYVRFGTTSLQALETSESGDVSGPRHDLDVAGAYERLVAHCATHGLVEGVNVLEAACAGAPLDTRRLFDVLGAGWSDEVMWDALVVGTEYVVHDIEGEVCMIDDDGVAEWKAGLGTLVGPPVGTEAGRAVVAPPIQESLSLSKERNGVML